MFIQELPTPCKNCNQLKCNCESVIKEFNKKFDIEKIFPMSELLYAEVTDRAWQHMGDQYVDYTEKEINSHLNELCWSEKHFHLHFKRKYIQQYPDIAQEIENDLFLLEEEYNEFENFAWLTIEDNNGEGFFQELCAKNHLKLLKYSLNK